MQESLGSTEEWYTKASIKTRQIAFLRKAVEELGHHQNVIWELINEGQVERPSPTGLGHSWYEDMRIAFRNAMADNGHLPGMLLPYGSPDHRDLSGHLSPGDRTHATDFQREYECVHGGFAPSDPSYNCPEPGLVNDYLTFQNPMIDDNDCCFQPGSPEQLRKKAWLSLTSGAHPSMLVYHVAGSLSPIGLGLDGNGNPIPSHETQRGMRYVGFTRKLIQELSVDLIGMEPRTICSAMGSSVPAWCLAREDEEYIVYFWNPGTVTIPGLSGKTYQSHWFDPISGMLTAGPGTGTSFTATGGHDQVLHVRLASPPPAPGGVQASDGLWGKVQVTWNAVPGATTYEVFRGENGVPPGSPIKRVWTPAFDDTTAEHETVYHYWVKAVNASGASPLSNPDTGFLTWDKTLSATIIADAWVSQNKPNHNYGSTSEIRVRAIDTGYGRYSFLKFEIPPFTGSVQSAVLRLHTQETFIPAAAMYEVSNMSWSENTVTWNNWQQPGVTFRYTGSLTPIPANDWSEYDVTDMISGPGELTIGIASSHNLPNLDFWSRESSRPPVLVITYRQ